MLYPYQKRDSSDPSDFKPVSLLGVIGKLQELFVFKHIHNSILIDNNLMYKYQSGFLPGHSATYQLMYIYHHICQAIDTNQFSCMVLCNVSKAFERVWHTGLIFKLRQYGIDGVLLNWITDYLVNRK